MMDDVLAIFSAFCWALNGAVYKIGLRYGDVLSANFVRVTLTSFGFLLIMFAKGELFNVIDTINFKISCMIIASAVFAFFLGDSLYMEAIRRCGVSKAVPLSSTFPLFVALWDVLVYGFVEPKVVLGAVLIVVAIFLVAENGGSESFGEHLAILAAIFWSLSIMLVKELTHYLPAEAIAGLRFAVVSILTVPFLALRGFGIGRECLKWMSISSLILLAGNYSFVLALSMAPASKVSTLSSIYPIIAELFALKLRERVTLRMIFGTFLGVAGVCTVVR